MTSERDAWSVATWEGSRRAQLRRSLRLTVRERLEVLDELVRTSEALVASGRRGTGSRTETAESTKGS